VNTQEIVEIIEELLQKLGIDDATVEESNLGEAITFNIATDSHALLIGRHGDNLRSLQHILNSILRHKDRNAEFVALDVADYKKGRQEKLMTIAQEAANKARAENTEVRLKAMNAFERRQVHMVLAEESDLVTESVGQEPHRTIVVRPRD